MHSPLVFVYICVGCTVQGIDPDSSDEEWDRSIQRDFGETGAGMLREAAPRVDEGLDTNGIVNHAFNMYEIFAESTWDAERSDPPEAGRAHVSRTADECTDYEGDSDGFRDDDLHNDNVRLGDEPDLTSEARARSLLEESSRTLLFAGARLSSLCPTLLLLNLCKTHGCSNIFVTELFTILAMSILPEINTLPRSEYQASKMQRTLGLSYKAIHACPNYCMLFRGGENARLRSCLVCHAPRYRRCGNSEVPRKVLRHFPLIPRLRRLFSTPTHAELQTWWHRNRSVDGAVRAACDSEQWKRADAFDQSFASEHRNIRLGLATDGLNPFSIKRSTWSTWPVLLLNYNIPPWLTTKKHFEMLALVIPGPRSVKGSHFDTFLEPLLQELSQLWHEGAMTHDASLYRGVAEFSLRAMLLWSIHDFPAYGLVSGCVTKGFRGCPVCGPATKSGRSHALKKCVYDDQHRKWLPEDHPYRRSTAFNGKVEDGQAPVRLSAQETVFFGQLRETFITNGATPKREDPARVYGINRVSALFRLPYWHVSITISMLLSVGCLVHLSLVLMLCCVTFSGSTFIKI